MIFYETHINLSFCYKIMIEAHSGKLLEINIFRITRSFLTLHLCFFPSRGKFVSAPR